ncbi:MAG: SMC-Scp complex subunit ScpB [Aeromonas sp.]
MTPSDTPLKALLEAAIFVAGRPLSHGELLAGVLADYDLSHEALSALLAELSQDYADRGVELKQVASGWRFQARQCYASELARLWREKPPRYSRSVLETLTIIAYHQPITRAEIEALRGVSVTNNVLTTLKERGWVHCVGHKEVAGRPELLATTAEFLDYFNLQHLDELPAQEALQPPALTATADKAQLLGNPDE